MKLRTPSLARRLHEQRISQPTDAATKRQPADWPGHSSSPSLPDGLQKTANHCNFSKTQAPPDAGAGSGPSQVEQIAPEAADKAPAPERKPPPRVAHRVKPLSQAQLNAIDLLILGHSDQSVASHCGLHRMTICNWRLHNPAFRAELAQRREQVWSAASDKFRATLEHAIEALDKQVRDRYQPTSCRAARTLLSLAHRFKPADDPVDVEGVLTLEARRLKVQKQELHPAQALVYEDEREEALQFLGRKAGEDFENERPAASTPSGAQERSEDLTEPDVPDEA